MVHLVLDDAGLEAARLDEDRLAVVVLGADADVDGRSTSTWTPGRLRQPSSHHSFSLPDHSISGLTSALTGLSCSTR